MLKLNPQLYKAQLLVYVSLFAMVLSFFHGVAWFPSLYFSKDLSNTLPDTEIHNRFSAESLPLKFDAVQIFSGHTSNPRIHVSANAKAALGRASRLQRARRAKAARIFTGASPLLTSTIPDDASSHTNHPFSTFQRFQYALFYIPIFKYLSNIVQFI